MRKYPTKMENRFYELGMQSGRKELEPTNAALLEALKVLQVRIFMLDGSENEEYQLASRIIAQAEGTVQV